MQQDLTQEEIEQFIKRGYLRVDQAFSSEVAANAREILWNDTGCNPHDRSTWTKPVVRLGMYDQLPFQQAVSSPVLHAMFDQLVGKGNWSPRVNLGTFPVRFPSPDDPGDTGWHVDASFPGSEPENFLAWRVNIKSKGRALLMLFLFSDVSEKDAPTRIAVGSHLDVARILEPEGNNGLSFMELANKLAGLQKREEVLATGKAGTVYLCHPFLAHAAQPHHGHEPRFLAQPPLIASKEVELHRVDGKYSPVEEGIRRGVLEV